MFNMNSNFNNPPKPADKTEEEISSDKKSRAEGKTREFFLV